MEWRRMEHEMLVEGMIRFSELPGVEIGTKVVILISAHDLRGNRISRGDVVIELGVDLAVEVAAGGAVKVVGVVVGVAIKGGKKFVKIAKVSRKWPKHHPWPQYLGGLRDQTLKKL